MHIGNSKIVNYEGEKFIVGFQVQREITSTSISHKALQGRASVRSCLLSPPRSWEQYSLVSRWLLGELCCSRWPFFLSHNSQIKTKRTGSAKSDLFPWNKSHKPVWNTHNLVAWYPCFNSCHGKQSALAAGWGGLHSLPSW